MKSFTLYGFLSVSLDPAQDIINHILSLSHEPGNLKGLL